MTILEKCKEEIKNEIIENGYICDSDNTEIFLDTVVEKYFDKDEEGVEIIRDWINKEFKKVTNLDDSGNYYCYYFDETIYSFTSIEELEDYFLIGGYQEVEEVEENKAEEAKKMKRLYLTHKDGICENNSYMPVWEVLTHEEFMEYELKWNETYTVIENMEDYFNLEFVAINNDEKYDKMINFFNDKLEQGYKNFVFTKGDFHSVEYLTQADLENFDKLKDSLKKEEIFDHSTYDNFINRLCDEFGIETCLTCNKYYFTHDLLECVSCCQYVCNHCECVCGEGGDNGEE